MRIRDPGDAQAWREFDDLYRPMLMRYARLSGLSHADAEDAVQHALGIVHEKIGAFEYDRARGRFRGWLRAVTNNCIRTSLRKRREGRAETEVLAGLPDGDATPDEAWERIWLAEHLRYGLEQIRDQVSTKNYEAFRRYVLDEWPVERVCQELAMRPGQVYVAKCRITDRLRAVLAPLRDGWE